MLMASASRQASNDDGLASAEPRRLEFGEVISILRRRWSTILLCTLIALLAGASYILVTPKLYTAQATIIIDQRRLQLFRQDSVTSDPTLDPATVESQIENIKSERVGNAVVRNLKLFDDPEFVGQDSGLLVSLKNLTGLSGPAEPPGEDGDVRKAVQKLNDRFDARRVGLSYAIQISFSSSSPAKAAKIANEIANAYITDQLESKFELTQRAGTWLQERIKELQVRASEAERAVVDYRTSNRLVDAFGKLVNEQQLVDLSSQLGAARNSTGEARARLARVREVLKAGVSAASIGDTVRNDVFSKLRQEYLDIVRRENDLVGRLGAGHQAVLQLRADLKRLEDSMLNEVRRLEQSYESDLEIALTREEAVQRSIAELTERWTDTRQAMVELRQLESAAQTLRTLHDTFAQRFLAVLQQQSFPMSDARVITAASVPASPTSPKKLIVLLGALCIGGGAGLSLALARELMDKSIRTSTQLLEASGLECLGTIPLQRAAQVDLSAQPLFRDEHGHKPDSDSTAPSSLYFVLHDPFSSGAEAIRHAKVAIDVERLTRAVKVVAIVSANAGEGKTTAAANLAFSLAQMGRKTLLIDGDLRRTSLSAGMLPSARKGLVEVLLGNSVLEAAVWVDEITKLHFLPTVGASNNRIVGDLLPSQRISNFLEQASEKYDYVVVDCPPINPVSDVKAFSQAIDAFILVVAWGETAREVVRRAARSDFIAGKAIGGILSRVDERRFSSYEDVYGEYYNLGAQSSEAPPWRERLQALGAAIRTRSGFSSG